MTNGRRPRGAGRSGRRAPGGGRTRAWTRASGPGLDGSEDAGARVPGEQHGAVGGAHGPQANEDVLRLVLGHAQRERALAVHHEDQVDASLAQGAEAAGRTVGLRGIKARLSRDGASDGIDRKSVV